MFIALLGAALLLPFILAQGSGPRASSDSPFLGAYFFGQSSSNIQNASCTLQAGLPPTPQLGDLSIECRLTGISRSDILVGRFFQASSSGSPSSADFQSCGAGPREWCVETKFQIFQGKAFSGPRVRVGAKDKVTFTFTLGPDRQAWTIIAILDGKEISRVKSPRSGPQMRSFSTADICLNKCSPPIVPILYTDFALTLDAPDPNLGPGSKATANTVEAGRPISVNGGTGWTLDRVTINP